MNKHFAVKYITETAILSTVAAVVMIFEIPLWFAPGFYKIDLSDVVALIGSFALGPLGGAIIEFIKNILHILFKGTSTAYVGELANFITGCFFVVPAGIIYRIKKNRTGAIAGMASGVTLFTAVGATLNYYVLIPLYSSLYGISAEAVISMANAVNSNVKSLETLIIFAVVPFNLIKGILCSVITFVLYKKLSPILHK